MSLPEVLLTLVGLLYMINQRAKAKMDPSVASTTKIHRDRLSTITGSTWAVGAVAICWTTTAGGGSEGNRSINYLNRLTLYILIPIWDLLVAKERSSQTKTSPKRF